MTYVADVATLFAIYALLAISLDIAIGHAGLLALWQGLFFGLGAYTSARIALAWEPSVTVACLAGFLAAATVALVLSIPALRLKGEYFLLLTLAFQMIATDLFQNLDGLTGGLYGLAGIPQPEIFGLSLADGVFRAVAFLVLAAFGAIGVLVVTRSPFGRALRAAREDPRAAESLGHDVKRLRRAAIAISAGIAGMAGALFALHSSYVEPSSFAMDESILILTMVALGGAASVRGPILGAGILLLIPELLRFLELPAGIGANVRQIVLGILLIVMMFVRPQGLLGRYSHDAG